MILRAVLFDVGGTLLSEDSYRTVEGGAGVASSASARRSA